MEFLSQFFDILRSKEATEPLSWYLQEVDPSSYSQLDYTQPLVILAIIYHVTNAFLILRTIKRPVRAATKVVGLGVTLYTSPKTYYFFQAALSYLVSKGFDLYLSDFPYSQTYTLLWIYPNSINLLLSAVVLILAVCGFLTRVVGCLVCV